MDLVAYFFRRAFDLIAQRRTIGLIATNTISQGDTREGGLTYICTNGGTIYNARRRVKWPGEASVVVSVVHVAKRLQFQQCFLDARPVEKITAYLFHQGGHESPKSLAANESLAFEGVKPAGQGFIFDDNDSDATLISVMEDIIANHSGSESRVFPYMSGREINDSPTQTHSRYIIDFFDLPLDQCEQWPRLLEIVRTKVKPNRDKANREAHKKYWWHYGEKRPGLRRAMVAVDRVIVLSRVGDRLAFVFQPTSKVFSEALVVFALPEDHFFGVLQSRIHETWARFFASSMKDDTRYTPSDCFDTFAFPSGGDLHIGTAARAYCDKRSAIMVAKDEGLTKTYNRFHDPHEKSSEIAHLRELHAAMDRAVLEAYGWEKLATDATCGFGLDYLDEDNVETPDTLWWPTAREALAFEVTLPKRKRKLAWRLRWPDDFRDEVLARLLELNEQRHQEELLAGSGNAGTSEADAPKAKSTKRKKRQSQTKELF
jgi:hypothetical protein